MKVLTRTLLFAFSLLIAVSGFAQDAQEKTLESSKPKLHPFNPQEPKRIQFSNGMVVFLKKTMNFH